MTRTALAAIVAVTALAGCAQVLGLDDTKHTPKDAPTDAPSACDGAPACVSGSGRSACGRIRGTGDAAEQPLTIGEPTGATCSVDNLDGPCALTISAQPLASFFAGTEDGKVAGTIDDCGRYVVADLEVAAVDVAIVVEGAGYRRSATLLLDRMMEPGTDQNIDLLAIMEATSMAWANQLSGTMPPDMTTGYLLRYLATGTNAALAGEQVAKDGDNPFVNAPGTVPWASYFGGDVAFGTLAPTATSTEASGTAFAVFGTGTFSADGFRPGRRCRVLDMQEVPNTLIFLTATGC